MREVEKIIQTLDIENNCYGVYCQDRFHFQNTEDSLRDATVAWRHSPILSEDDKWTYVNLFLKNVSLSEYSSDPVTLKATENILEAQKSAAITAKIDFSELCFYEILPDHLLHRWFSLREQAMSNVLKSVQKPKDYDILHKIHVVVENISRQNLSVSGANMRVKYDMMSSATGRLATSRGSYPILNISKEERSSVKPQNDLFLELDLNGAEIRTLLAFSGQEQPDYDIHEFNRDHSGTKMTRQEMKSKFFAWLYNPKAVDYDLEKLYNKDVYKKHYNNGKIETPFGRDLEVDERKALNYLLQSTTSDIVLQNAYEIMNLLKGKKSKVAFTMHDSVVLDFAKEDHGLVSEIKEIFETNIFGKFMSTVNIGKNFGNLKEIAI